MAKDKAKSLILGIETSCDETAAAVVADGAVVLSNRIHSQIDIHAQFGGVVPEIASRNHTMAITTVVEQALADAGVTLDELTGIGVTYGAGLLGALLVGVSYAKALSYALNLPLVKVNHIEAHVAANFLFHKPPFMCLVVSGGHTQIVKVADYHNYEVLASTTDDAAGEAFDKAARVLGLPYPGGPQIDRLAKEGNPTIDFFKHSRGIQKDDRFSYSGLKTAVINYLHQAKQKGQAVSAPDVAASFTVLALNPLIETAIKLTKKHGLKLLTTAGGVSANSYLRKNLLARAAKEGLEAAVLPSEYCTDNAVMVAVRAHHDLICGKNIADKTLSAVSFFPR